MQLALRTATSLPLPRPTRIGPRRRGSTPPSFTPAAIHADPLHLAIGIEQLFQCARDALVVVELQSGRITRWNAAAEELFGYPAADTLGTCIDRILPPEAAHVHFKRVEQYRRMADSDIFLGRPPTNLRVRTSSGRELPVELSAAPLALPGRSAEWLLLTFRDAQCRQDLEQATFALARAEKANRQLESNLAHSSTVFGQSVRELEVPLARVRRASRRLARMAAGTGQWDPERVALLARLLEARTEELERQMALLGDMSAIETGTLELNTQRVNLVPLVSRIVAAARARSTAHRLNFAAPQGLTAMCDPDRVGALVEDLIRRAIRRNPRGCWIDVDLRRPLAGMARIEVRDYGRGLSRTEREQWLDKPCADRAWFIAQHVVERHRGTLTVEFPREGGVRASLSLPTHRGRTTNGR